jgi:hypothetical protein
MKLPMDKHNLPPNLAGAGSRSETATCVGRVVLEWTRVVGWGAPPGGAPRGAQMERILETLCCLLKLYRVPSQKVFSLYSMADPFTERESHGKANSTLIRVYGYVHLV